MQGDSESSDQIPYLNEKDGDEAIIFSDGS